MELKPCPFCGGQAHLRDDSYHSTAFYIGCEKIGCFGHDMWGETEAEAVTEWNTRASDARIADLERQLAQAQAVKVKPLEWYEVDDTGGDWISAFTGSVSYTVKKLETWDEYYDETGIRHLFVVDVSAHGHERLAETHRTEEAAKAAAQDHHEARILSALEPTEARAVSVPEAARVLLAGGHWQQFAPAFSAMDARWEDGPEAALSAALRALGETQP